jgi:DNA-3-methyladenine glycosylase II
MLPLYWPEALAFLSRTDAIMAQLIVRYPTGLLKKNNNPFETLSRAIVGQQISVKAADTVWQRLTEKLETFAPSDLLALEVDILRGCGLSRQKISYLIAIAEAFEQQTLTPDDWEMMNDGEIIDQLVKVKGIGPWTAEMFLIFYLHRPDVFPLTDLGLINAVRLNYGEQSKAEILKFSRRWQPYRTVATWYLWRSLDPMVVQY